MKVVILSLTIALLISACAARSASSAIESTETPLQKRERSTLLKGKQAEAILSQCSRAAPGRFEGIWQPSDSEIAEMESKLNDIRKLRVDYLPEIAKELNLEDSFMQYAGIVTRERKLIYINAFPNEISENWRENAVVVCDGGPAFWGVEYDPAKKEFFNLYVNGSG